MKKFVYALIAAFVASAVVAGNEAVSASDRQTLDLAQNTAQNGSDAPAQQASPKEAKGSTTTKVNIDSQGVILKGCDVVAYFRQGNAVKGIPQSRAPFRAPHIFLPRQRIKQ